MYASCSRRLSARKHQRNSSRGELERQLGQRQQRPLQGNVCKIFTKAALHLVIIRDKQLLPLKQARQNHTNWCYFIRLRGGYHFFMHFAQRHIHTLPLRRRPFLVRHLHIRTLTMSNKAKPACLSPVNTWQERANCRYHSTTSDYGQTVIQNQFVCHNSCEQRIHQWPNGHGAFRRLRCGRWRQWEMYKPRRRHALR